MTACLVLGPAFARGEAWRPVRVAAGVYAFVGALEEPSVANGGRVGNAGFVVGPSGVVVIDSGISYCQGQAMLAAIARVTAKPVKLAILTHARQEFIFGAAAYRERGIPLLAHRQTAELMQARCESCLGNLRATLGEAALRGTEVVTPEWQVERSLTLGVAGRRLELIAFGRASAPGDLAVFDPTSGVLFAGGLVSAGRVPELRDADFAGWLAALAELSRLPARRVVPGYGPVSDPGAIAATGDYLKALRESVRARYGEGASLTEAMRDADLPAYRGWAQYAVRHPLNVQHIYLSLERDEFR